MQRLIPSPEELKLIFSSGFDMEELQALLGQLLGQDTAVSNVDSILKYYLLHVNKRMLTGEFLNELFKCTRNSERIQLVSRCFVWKPLDSSTKERFKKNSIISKELLAFADDTKNPKEWPLTLRALNIALLFAPREDVPLVLGKRDKILALSTAVDAVEECNGDIGKGKGGNKISNLNASRISEEMKLRSQRYKELFTLLRVNPLIPSAHSDVEIRTDPAKGRGLYATKDIPLGTTILVERPFVAALANSLEWDVEHCHHCLKQNVRCIPCPTCVFVCYCNEECREEARSYHQYECPCYPELHLGLKDDLLANFILVFRMICSLGPTKLYQMFKEKHPPDADNDSGVQLELDPDTGIYDPGSYRPMYHLMSTINPREGYYFILISLLLAETLRKETRFFGDISPEEEVPFRDFVAQRMLHHFETFRMNVFGFCGIRFECIMKMRGYLGDGKAPLQEYDYEPSAAGALPTASLINHSCDPNLLRFTGTTWGRSAFMTLRRVKEGEELTISYGLDYGSGDEGEGAEVRRADLMSGYGFICRCVACLNGWNGIETLQRSRDEEFLCPQCSRQMPYERLASLELKGLCELTKEFNCPSCGVKYQKDEFLQGIEKQRRILKIAEGLVLSNNPLSAIESLKHALDYLGDRCSPPDFDLFKGQLLLREALNLTISHAEL